MRAWVCVVGNLMAMPAFNIAMLTSNFYLSMVMVATKYLVGEPWKTSAVTMMQNTVNSNKFGNIVSAYQFFYIMTGSISTYIF